MDFAVSFKKFTGTGTYLNAVPFNDTSYFELCSIDPDVNNTDFSTFEMVIEQQKRISSTQMLLAGRIDLQGSSSPKLLYKDIVLVQFPSFTPTYGMSRTFLISLDINTKALVPYRVAWVIVADPYNSLASNGYLFQSTDAKFALTSTNEIYFLVNFVGGIVSVYQYFNTDQTFGVTASVDTSTIDPTYQISTFYLPYGSSTKGCVAIVKVQTNGQMSKLNGQDWGYHLIVSTQELSSLSLDPTQACEVTVDNANNLVATINSYLQPQGINLVNSLILYNPGLWYETDVEIHPGTQSIYMAAFDKTIGNNNIFFNFIDNALDYPNWYLYKDYSTVSVIKRNNYTQELTYSTHLDFNRYVDLGVTRNCFSQNDALAVPPATVENQLYSVCTYGEVNYVNSGLTSNIDIYRYDSTVDPPTASIVAYISGQQANITATTQWYGNQMYIFFRSSDSSRAFKAYRYNPFTNVLTFLHAVACPGSYYPYTNISSVKFARSGWTDRVHIIAVEMSSPRSTSPYQVPLFAVEFDFSVLQFTAFASSTTNDGCQSNLMYSVSNAGVTTSRCYITIHAQPNVQEWQVLGSNPAGTLTVGSIGSFTSAQSGWLLKHVIDQGTPSQTDVLWSYSPNIQAAQMWDNSNDLVPSNLGKPFVSTNNPAIWNVISPDYGDVFGLMTDDLSTWNVTYSPNVMRNNSYVASWHVSQNFATNLNQLSHFFTTPEQYNWLAEYTDVEDNRFLVTAGTQSLYYVNVTNTNNIIPSYFTPLDMPAADWIKVVQLDSYPGYGITNLMVLYNTATAAIYSFIVDFRNGSYQLLVDTQLLTFYNYVPNGFGRYTPTTTKAGVIATVDVVFDPTVNTLRMFAMSQEAEYFTWLWDTDVNGWVLQEQSIWENPIALPQVVGAGYLSYFENIQTMGWMFGDILNALTNTSYLNFYVINTFQVGGFYVSGASLYNMGNLIPRNLHSTSFVNTSIKTLTWYDSTNGKALNLDVSDMFYVTQSNAPYVNAGDVFTNFSNCSSYVLAASRVFNFVTTNNAAGEQCVTFSLFGQELFDEQVINLTQQLPLNSAGNSYVKINDLTVFTTSNNIYLAVLYSFMNGPDVEQSIYIIDVTNPDSVSNSTQYTYRSYGVPTIDGFSWMLQVQSDGQPGWGNYFGGNWNYATTGPDGPFEETLIAHDVQARSLTLSPDKNSIYACGIWSNNIDVVNYNKNGNLVDSWSFNDLTTRGLQVDLISSWIGKFRTSDGVLEWILPLTSSSEINANVVATLSDGSIIVYGQNRSDAYVHETQLLTSDPSVTIQLSIAASSLDSAYVLKLTGEGVYEKLARIFTEAGGRYFKSFQLAVDDNQVVVCGTSNANVVECIDETGSKVQQSFSRIDYTKSLNAFVYYFDTGLKYLGSNIIDFPDATKSALTESLSLSQAYNTVDMTYSYVPTDNTNPVVIYNKDGSIGINKPFYSSFQAQNCVVVDFKYKYSYTDAAGNTYSQIVYHSGPSYSFTGGEYNNYNVFVFGQEEDTILNHNFGVKNNAIVTKYIDPFSMMPITEDVLYLNTLIDVSKIIKMPLQQFNVPDSENYFSFQLTNAPLSNFIRVSGYSPPNIVFVEWSAFPIPSSLSGAFITFPSGTGSITVVPILNSNTAPDGTTALFVDPGYYAALVASPDLYFIINSFNQSVYYSLQFFPGSLIAPQYYDIQVSGLTIPDRPLLNNLGLGGVRSFNDYPFLYLSIYSQDDNGGYDPEFVNVIYDNTPLSNVKPFPQFLIPVSGLQPSSLNFTSFSSVLTGVVKFSKDFLNLRIRLLDIDGNPIQFDQSPSKPSDLSYVNGIPDYLFNMYIRLIMTAKSK